MRSVASDWEDYDNAVRSVDADTPHAGQMAYTDSDLGLLRSVLGDHLADKGPPFQHAVHRAMAQLLTVLHSTCEVRQFRRLWGKAVQEIQSNQQAPFREAIETRLYKAMYCDYACLPKYLDVNTGLVVRWRWEIGDRYDPELPATEERTDTDEEAMP